MPLRNIFADACPCYGGSTYESKKNFFVAKNLLVRFVGTDRTRGNGPATGPAPCQPRGNLAILTNICRGGGDTGFGSDTRACQFSVFPRSIRAAGPRRCRWSGEAKSCPRKQIPSESNESPPTRSFLRIPGWILFPLPSGSSTVPISSCFFTCFLAPRSGS
ncbi:MAG: hypothetical protein QOD12_3090 [Verrucomicrobiota bacterium]